MATFIIKLDFSEIALRNEVKALGGKWNPDTKTWSLTCDENKMSVALRHKTTNAASQTPVIVQNKMDKVFRAIESFLKHNNEIVGLRRSARDNGLSVITPAIQVSDKRNIETLVLYSGIEVDWSNDERPSGKVSLKEALALAIEKNKKDVALNQEAIKEGYKSLGDKVDTEYRDWYYNHDNI